MNLPRKHHYLPQFLLRTWADETGKLQRFAKPRGSEVHVRSAYPKEVGFEQNLYAAPPGGNPSFDAERDVFQKVDSLAAQAHARMMLLQRPTATDRHAWSAFVMSLFHRTPEHLKSTKAMLGAIWDSDDLRTQARYEAVKAQTDPATVQEFLLMLDPHARERAAFRNILLSLQDSPLGRLLSRIPWCVLNLDKAPRSLLLSDNPIMLAPLGQPQGHIALPIGPRRLFVAAPDPDTFIAIKRMSLNVITRNSNKAVVEHATELVIASDRSQRGFVESHMGANPIGSLASGFRTGQTTAPKRADRTL
jgi:hypothetical protein